jgi:hypothetical protein
MNDLVGLAMERAAREHGGREARESGRLSHTFNAANFSNAMMKLAGLEGAMDGELVRAVLCGRQDVEVLSGGSHFRYLEQGGDA